MQTSYGDRQKCYKCYRPQSSCMCEHVHTIETQTKFIILMHPKEFKKIKNGTGHLTHLALKNSELFVGIDFSDNKAINEIIFTHNSFVLYPSKDAINLSSRDIKEYTNDIEDKKTAIFLIDSTWACSIKMLRESKNLKALKHISFENTKLSQFKIKEQPADYCLSTIESTLTVLELLNKCDKENIKSLDLDMFLNPFHKMIEYQIKYIENPLNNAIRYKSERVK